ncbi:MAG: hypothetical protein ABIQ73_24690 [Acidimicrobiales bacterium]
MKDSKDWLAAVERQAGDQLDGETFVTAYPLATRGYIRRSARAAAGLISAKGTRNAINGESLPNTMVFGLTTTRLFVFELVTKTAKAGEIKAIVPLEVITAVTSMKFKSYFVPRLNVDISLYDNDQLLLEAGWPGLDKAERFVDTLTSATANRNF